MKILGIERDETACNHYRVLQPLYKLREHRMVDILTINDREIHTEYALEKVLEADIILFQRPASDEWFNFIKLCQKHGKIIVCDYDDDPFNTNPLNPFYKFVGTKEYYYEWPSGEVDQIWADGQDGFDIERNIHRNDMFQASFRNADMVTTTTDILKDEFLKINNNVKVLPNLIDFHYYKKYGMVKNKIRILYQCGSSHYEDLYFIKGAIKEVLKQNDNAVFIYLGDLRFKNLFQDIPDNQIEYFDWVKQCAYPYLLSLSNCDIGMCPLVDNEFNRNKSNIKFLDYCTQKAAVVASNIPPYSNTIVNGETGLLVNNEKEWIEALNTLIRDAAVRKKISDNSYDLAWNEYNVDKKIHLWRDVYDSLLRQEVMA